MLSAKPAWQFIHRTNDPRLSMLRKFAAAVGCSIKSLFKPGTPMCKCLKTAASLLSLSLCAALIVLWVRSYRTAYSLKAPIGQGVVVMEGRCWFDDAIWEYVLQAPYLEGYAGYQRAGWTLNIWTITSPTIVPSDINGATPIWLAVLVSAALVSAPWVRWRYRIRTLLLATTGIAAWLGFLTRWS